MKKYVMKQNINHKTLFIIILSILSFVISIYQSKYYYDGHHWGLMLSNAIDFLDGKKPYEEIFIQYGILNTIFHAIFVKFGNSQVISLFYGISLFYSLSIILLFKYVENKFDSNYGIFVILCLLLIHPFVNHPWHNYLGFFFLILALNIYDTNSKNNTFFFGICLSLIVLLYEKLLFIFLLFSLIFLFESILRKKMKVYFFFLIGFLIPISIFFLFLFYNNLFDTWITYQKISSLYLEETSYFKTIMVYLEKLFLLSFKNIIYEPYWLFFSIIIIININFVIFYFLNFNIEKEIFFFPSIISILYISTTIHAINSFRFVTGTFIGIIILLFYLKKIKKIETKIILSSFIILFLSLGLNFKKSENNKLFLQNYKINENVSYDSIKYFKGQKWSEDTWDNLIHLEETLTKIKKNCPNIKFGINITRDSYYYILISEKYETFQKMPFFDPNSSINRDTMKLINQAMFKKKDQYIADKSLLIIADKTFIKNEDYKEINMKYSYNHKQKSIFLPKKCNY